MYRNWISIIVIVSALVAWVAIDSACTKNSDDTQTVRFDPLAGTCGHGSSTIGKSSNA